MSFEDPEIITNILYFIREKYFHNAMVFINDGIKRYGNEPCLKLLTGICLIYEERYTEAIRDLELITDKADVCIGAYIALATAYKKSQKVDQNDCENKVRELRKSPADLTFYFAGMTLFLFERYDKAKEYLTRALKSTSYTKETHNLLGWVEVMSNKEKNQENAKQIFDKTDSNDVDSLLGKLKCLEVGGHYKLALEAANKLIVKHNKFLPGLLEKMHILLTMKSWDEVYDTASRCLLINSGCVEALKLQILKVLCVEGYYEETSSKIGDLIQLLDRYEPKNAYQYHRCANLFARICGRNSLILDQCLSLQDRAINLFPESIEYNNGLGSIYLLQNNTRQAIKCFNKSLELDSTNLKALQGRIACQISENMLKEASTQLELLNEMQSNIEISAELKYLTAIIKRKENENQFTILSYLDEAIKMHFSQLSNMHFSANYIYALNPDFLIQLVQEKLSFCSEPSTPGSSSSSSSLSQADLKILRSVVTILENIVRFLPGMQKAGFLLARSYFLLGNYAKCKVLLDSCLQSDQSFSEAHILMAQIHYQDGNYKLADHALEVGLSYNFQVRENPLFHLLKGRILLRQGKSVEAKQVLQNAYALPGVRLSKGAMNLNKSESTKYELSSSDRLSIYLELADALRQTGETHESAKILQDAQTDFAGTPEEARITISNADLAVQRGDIETAITILRSVTSDHIYFVEARKTMAHIYLKYRRDKKLYAACFRELVDRNKTPDNLILLGDAYMEIQQPDKAINIYEEASTMKEGDLELIGKMGLALVKTHQFAEAIKYYNKVVKSGKTSLRKDLVQLLINLQMYDEAKSTIVKGIGELNKGNDYASNVEVVQLYLLYAQIYERIEDHEAERKQLEEARSIQAKVLKKVVMQNPDGLVGEKKLATEINHKIAHSYIKSNNHVQALEVFEEIRSKFNANDPETILQIARLKLLIGDVENCQQECLALLKLEDENNNKILLQGGLNEEYSDSSYASEATMMMAELMIQRLDFDTALIHLKKLLKKEKNHYKALATLIDVLRRNGELDEAETYFKSIRENDPNQEISPGYNFCRGIYEWYMSNSSKALTCFNKARSDRDYDVIATINMIEICINPDNDTMGGDVMDQFDQQIGMDATSKSESGNGIKSAISNMRTAESLWRELPPDEPRKGYLQHMINTATKQKGSIERAYMYFTDNIKEEEKTQHINILNNYGAAVASLMNKQLNKAKTYLTSITNISWTKQYAEEHEKSWILLADYYIQNKFIQEAHEILDNCIKYNKSCFKAYEYKGLIHEKEQNYKEAAINYSQAWIHCHKNDPSIGYKLAYNFLRAQRYVDSVDICLEVLKNNPKYPKIRKEILEKARLSIRV